MNLVSRRLILSAVLVFFLAAAGAVASAAPTVTWAADPRTGCQIGYVNAYWSLAAATWTGPAVNGKAEGMGQISLTIRSKDGKEQLTISGETETVAGLMDGKVLLKWTDGDSYDGYYKAGLRRQGAD